MDSKVDAMVSVGEDFREKEERIIRDELRHVIRKSEIEAAILKSLSTQIR